MLLNSFISAVQSAIVEVSAAFSFPLPLSLLGSAVAVASLPQV
jgi:hypothetical protein